MVRILALFLTWALAFCPGAAQNAAAPSSISATIAGKAELVEGDVTVLDRAKSGRRIRVGESLYEGDAVVTGRDGELHVAMDDGGYLAVRPNTNMSILAYQAQGRDDDRSILNLAAGSFRSITGWIGRHNPRAYQVRTQTATIGIRGTDHEPLVIAENSPEGEPGTYDKVNAGGTFIESTRGRGRIDVTPNRAGFAPLRGDPAPRLLASVPRWYRATGNERRLVNKHEAAQKSFDRLREERRRTFEDRRKADARKDTRGGAEVRERDKPKAVPEQRREFQRQPSQKRDQQQPDERKQTQEARRKEPDRRRDEGQQERAQRLEQKRSKSEEHPKPKAELRKREGNGDAARNRNRD